MIQYEEIGDATFVRLDQRLVGAIVELDGKQVFTSYRSIFVSEPVDDVLAAKSWVEMNVPGGEM